MQTTVEQITDLVISDLHVLASKGASLTVEGIQDIVEVCLMKAGHHDVARDYIIYRDQHKALREDSPLNLKIVRSDGSIVRFNPMKIASSIEDAFRRNQHIEGPATEQIVDAVNMLTQKVVARADLPCKSWPRPQYSPDRRRDRAATDERRLLRRRQKFHPASRIDRRTRKRHLCTRPS